MTRRKHPRRAGPAAWLAALALAVTPLGVLAPPGQPAAASPPPAPATQAGPDTGTITLDGVAPGDHQITLISGDRVTLHDLGDHEYRISVGPRQDGTRPDRVETDFPPDTGAAYVYPDDALLAISEGRLDRELFNVAYLAEYGYTDAERDSLPLIVQYPDTARAGVAASARALPAGQLERTLPSIDAAAMTVPRAEVAELWAAISPPPTPDGAATADADAPTVWLDKMYRVQLEDSVPQVGAPGAWDAGYDGAGATVAVLDTGIDDTHPDVAGQVDATESFVGGAPVDRHGHGTHVAATVAGTGAGADGRRPGVAPGARLLIGKVCLDSGFCPGNSMIAGMEWAVAQGADVVSMSIGTVEPSDGTDALSQAVNDLSGETLFVISAGNNGLNGDFTVSAPAAADAALAVGAVDKAGGYPHFSSRGPRGPEWIGDYALKPEIAAPGVGIVAARATGTSLGTPVDDLYTAATGTSMAAPHVSGAAAILSAQHPDWNADQLKAALVSTADDLGHTVYRQGGGRLAVDRAVRQQVRVSPAVADFRAVPTGEPTGSQHLTYHNPTDQPVTLDLAGELANTTGDAPPAGTLRLSTEQVTVPAGSSATVAVSVAAEAAPAGVYSGRVTAIGPDGTRLTTPVGLGIRPPVHELTVTVVDRADGECRPVRCYNFRDTYTLQAIDGPLRGYVDSHTELDRSGDNQHTFVVPEGTYMARTFYRWRAGQKEHFGLLNDPEVVVTSDTEVVLDANDLRPLRVETPLPAEWVTSDVAYCTIDSAGESYGCDGIFVENVWVTPGGPETTGTIRFAPSWLYATPRVALALPGPEPVALHPTRLNRYLHRVSPWPAGTRELPVVDVGAGTAEEIAEVDLDGALAFRSEGGCWVPPDSLESAEAAGAVAMISAVHGPCAVPHGASTNYAGRLPAVHLTAADTALLSDRLAEGPVAVEVTGNPDPPYLYRVQVEELGSIPEDTTYTFTGADLAVVDNHLHAAEPTTFSLASKVYRPGYPAARAGTDIDLRGPRTVREYVAGPPEVILRTHMTVQGGEPGPLCNLLSSSAGRCERAFRTFPPGGTHHDVHWNADPTGVGAPQVPAGLGDTPSPVVCAGCRQGDTFAAVANLTTPEPGHLRGYLDAADSDTRLFHDGQELPATRVTVDRSPYQGEVDTFELPAGPGEYRLVQESAVADTSWWFTSGRPDADRTPAGTECLGTFTGGADTPCAPSPLVFLRYDAGVDLANTVPVPGAHVLNVSAYHQAADAPRIEGLEVSYRTGGGDWTPARVIPGGGEGEFRALLLPGRTGEAVDLRVTAWDADGNRVEQTVTDAYGLSGRCDVTITGTHAGPLPVTGGTTCLADGARVVGPVTVGPGAGLVATGARIAGPVSAHQAATVQLHDSRLSGSLSVAGVSGQVVLAGSRVTGPVSLVDNHTGMPVVVSGNRITGGLFCTGNLPAAAHFGLPNTVHGPVTGDCAG